MAFRRPGRRAPPDPDKVADQGAIQSAATALLRMREHSVAELEDKLGSRGFDRAAVSAAVAELCGLGLVDDTRFAQSFVRWRAGRGQGPIRIGMELRDRGLAQDLISTALDSIPSWAAVARDVRVRKFGIAPADSWEEKGRQARFLQYRGFSSDHIRSALGSDFDPDLPS